jgi:hypothetical protein
VRERWREARTRLGAGVKLTAGLAALAFLGMGGWIFYNTNILNEYSTPRAQLQRKAEYEKNWGRYENAPTPSYDSIEMAMDIFPEERRMESCGSAILGNHKKAPISEFMVSVNPALRVHQIAVENTALAQSDQAQGVYLFRLNAPLAPGATVKMTWNVTRSNVGFVNGEPDNALVANGTYLDTLDVMPIPGFNEGCRITDNAERRQYGLPPAPRTPKMGDPAYADKFGFGVDSRAAFEIVLSTSADQIAVAPGVPQKEWQQEGQRYFHYKAEEPILPNLSFCSARYAIARDRWQDVALEIYYDPKHQALRNFQRDFGFQTAPCPTSRDLVNALRAEAGPEYQQLITDLFERIVLYDLQVDAARARQIDGGYETAIEVTAKQFAADGHGKETKEPLDSWFDVAVFSETDKPLEEVMPLYIEKYRLRSGKQTLTVRTAERPGIAALDPFHKMIERSAGNNSSAFTSAP